MDSLLFAAVVIIALVIGAIFLPRWIRRSSRSASERTARNTAESRTDSVLSVLGTTLVIHAPEPVAREIVDRVVLQQPRKFAPIEGGGYGIRFVEPDDAIVRLVEQTDGTRMQIEAAREHLGKPQNVDFWKELRSRVASGAGALEISVADGIRLGYTRHDGPPAVWRLDQED